MVSPKDPSVLSLLRGFLRGRFISIAAINVVIHLEQMEIRPSAPTVDNKPCGRGESLENYPDYEANPKRLGQG